MMQPYAGEGKWYRGALHVHTTVSDGKRTPEVVAALYKQRGFDFMAFTDHRQFIHHQELSTSDFLVMPGMEIDIRNKTEESDNHLVVLRKKISDKNPKSGYQWPRPEKWEGLQTVQSEIDALNAQDCMLFYCHPIWSRCELSHFVDLQGIIGIEIYNHACNLDNRTGLSDVYWDSLLRRGRNVYAFATDDCHHNPHLGGNYGDDVAGGYVMVKAEALTEECIIEAIAAGRFYASTGPEIFDFGVRDGVAYIQTGPVREIHFVAWERHGKSFVQPDGATITEAQHKLKGQERFIRAEVVDAHGRSAWTQAIFL